MTDFRALCVELVDGFSAWTGYGGESDFDAVHTLITRARAALAEDPVGPTDEELQEMWFGSEWFNEGATLREFISIARAVLARWGHSE